MVKKLDYSTGAKPLYAQLFDILVDKLHSGEFKKNDVLPTEAQFQAMFGVSRITARRALLELANKGYVKRERGIGTLVIRNSKEPSINVSTRLGGDLDQTIVRQNLSLARVAPPAEVQRVYGLEDTSTVLCLTRVLKRRCSKPSQINYVYLHPEISCDDITEFDNGLYFFMEKRQHNIESYRDSLTAGFPNESECEYLECEATTALLIRKRQGFDFERRVIEFTISKHISDDYEYIVEYS